MYLWINRKTLVATSCGGGDRLCMCVLVWYVYIYYIPKITRLILAGRLIGGGRYCHEFEQGKDGLKSWGISVNIFI